MPNILKIIVSISILIFLFYVLRNVKRNKLDIKNALIWIVMSTLIIICIFQIENLQKIAHFIGIEKASNMIFFMGFIFLIFVCFNLTKIVSVQNRKIVQLTQELAILEKKERDKNVKKK